MGQDNCKPQPGDLIVIDQEFHQHWALYVGDEYVIHLTDERPPFIFTRSSLHATRARVKKQLLREVVKNHKWRVNNKYDHYCYPRPERLIIRRAEQLVGKEVPYNMLSKNCEHFVTELRYGKEVSDKSILQKMTFVGGKIPTPDTRYGKDYPNPGDLIDIKKGSYEHWALYVGDGYVIHMTPLDENAAPSSASSETIPIRKVKATKELLKEVVGNDDWAVNNKCDGDRMPLPMEEIIRRAEGCIGNEMPYDELGMYSEDFVKSLRYGGQSILQWRTFFGGKWRIPDMRYHKDYPSPADLIEIKQEPYEHWALYMGDGYVIHMTPLDENVAPSSASSETIPIRKVKATKELLKEVVGNDDWAVNNKCDGYRTPLPVEEIIRRAEEQIGEEVQYDELGMYSEDFVKNLRYGGQMTRSISDCPKPGDLIEIYRPGYQHWALYLWSGYVIHVTAVDGNTSSLSASSVTIITKRAKVAKEPLEKVVGNDTWHVNNNNDRFRTPRPIGVIIQHAMEWIDKKWRYELLYSNCEHFVTMLRYGDGISWQAINTRLVPEVISTVFVKKTKSGDSVR